MPNLSTDTSATSSPFTLYETVASGIVVTSTVAKYYSSEAHRRLSYYSTYLDRWIYETYYVSVRTEEASTLAFLPLVVQIPCFVLGLLSMIKVAKSMPKKEVVANVKTETVAEVKPVEEKKDAFEELKKFKELLDMGAITQEEYDAKKKELLNL